MTSYITMLALLPWLSMVNSCLEMPDLKFGVRAFPSLGTRPLGLIDGLGEGTSHCIYSVLPDRHVCIPEAFWLIMEDFQIKSSRVSEVTSYLARQCQQ